MRTIAIAALAALTLAGCSTPEQRAAEMQAEMSRMMIMYGPACDKLGYASKSDSWRDCVLQLSAKDDIQRYGYPHYYAGYGRSRWALGGMWGPYY